MYSIDTEIRYKIYDIYGGNESYWLSNMNEVKKNLKKMSLIILSMIICMAERRTRVSPVTDM